MEEMTQDSAWSSDSDSATGDLSITSLPEVALVNIMSYLHLKDQYHLSLTCRTFNDLFHHPKLWQKAYIVLLTQGITNTKNYARWKVQTVMHQTMAEIVHRFSHLFKYLTLRLFGYVQPFDDTCRQMLKDLNEECRLESLVLELGALASNDDYMCRVTARRSKFNDLPLIVGLIKKATCLKRLNIVSWPLHIEVGDDKNIFKGMISNEKLIESLESLSIFYAQLQDDPWTERNPKLPSAETTVLLVKHFRKLTHLALRSPMIDNDTLLELASSKRSPLNLLQILIVYAKGTQFISGYSVPEISSKAWSALKASSPCIKVEYLVMTRIPHDQLSAMLKPEVPLSSIITLKYGRCDVELIHSLAEKYKSTLEKFVSQCDSSECDLGLIHLVHTCPSLKHLAYHGEVHFKTVMKLADLIKDSGQEYECFEFKEANIQTRNVPNEADADIVIALDPERQEHYPVSLRSWHQDEDERMRLLDLMRENVSKALGYRWSPM